MSNKTPSLLIYFIAVIIAIALHAVIILALSKINIFGFFNYFNEVIIANLSYEKHENPPKPKELPKQDIPESIDEIEKIQEDYITHTNDDEKGQGDTFLTDLQVQLPDIKLEVPKLHDDLLMQTSVEDKRVEKIVLKYTREHLEYDLFWVGIYVGHARLSAEKKDAELIITSEVHSSKFISNFYKVQDYARSILINGRPHNFRIKQHEGKYRSDKETFFDYQDGTITFVDYLKNKQVEHSVKDNIFWDVISGFYYLRNMPVIDTDKIFVNVFDSNKFIKVQIVILGKEKIEMRNGDELNSIKAKVILHSEGLFQKVGDIIIWLKDDDHRIPLKVETKVPVGKVTAELKKREVSN
ncbi:MAG TPA: DUF3108 domain-containing protein [Nitrospirae bacterium]|nr:DUF3108 domain-containing protein [Nitrospirota bacterium]